MSHYRRAKVEGTRYFFTVVSYRRQAILCDAPVREALRVAIHRYVEQGIYPPDWAYTT